MTAPRGAATRPAATPEAPLFEEHTVWHMDEGFFYRVATLCLTREGTILAFADGRLAPPDGSPSHMLLKRSVDGGLTWSTPRLDAAPPRHAFVQAGLCRLDHESATRFNLAWLTEGTATRP